MKQLQKQTAEGRIMTVKNRILAIRLSEKLDKNTAYSQQLGVKAQLRKCRSMQGGNTGQPLKKGERQ